MINKLKNWLRLQRKASELKNQLKIARLEYELADVRCKILEREVPKDIMELKNQFQKLHLQHENANKIRKIKEIEKFNDEIDQRQISTSLTI